MFDHYSSLFTSGLLTDSASTSSPAPWSAESLGPRRGSLPMSIDTSSVFSDPDSSFFHSASATSTRTSRTPNTADSSLYFTFKKKSSRGPEQHLSFLSLDLAESRSLRSSTNKQKHVASPSSKRAPLPRLRTSNIPSSFKESFVPAFSPPPTFSPPASPLSAQSDPDPSIASLLAPTPVPVASQPSRRSSHILPRLPPSPSITHPVQQQRQPRSLKRELSPMRFAPPSPPPLAPLPPPPVTLDAEVLSRASTISSTYRRTQRVDALSRLEGKCADGAVGRLKPRLSQNFMHLSDDEDEEENWADRGMSIVVQDIIEEEPIDVVSIVNSKSHSRSRRHSLSRRRSSSRAGRSLSISVNGQPWLSLTPRQNAWGVLFNGEEDGDIDVEVDKIFGLDTASPKSQHADADSCASPKPKRSKRSFSPRMRTENENGSSGSAAANAAFATKPLQIKIAQPTPKYAFPASILPVPRTQTHSHSRSSSASRSRPRTVSDFGTSIPHAVAASASASAASQSQRHSRNQTHIHAHAHAHAHNHAHASRRISRTEWSTSTWTTTQQMGEEEPSFIDMRDDCLETESRPDSWRSLFEVGYAH